MLPAAPLCLSLYKCIYRKLSSTTVERWARRNRITTMSKVRIALAQIQPISAPEKTSLDEDISANHPFPTLRANLDQLEQHVKVAKADGADIVVFPEYLQGILNEDRQVGRAEVGRLRLISVPFASFGPL